MKKPGDEGTGLYKQLDCGGGVADAGTWGQGSSGTSRWVRGT
jgi:hypothetical protein